jgi:hypothetical protein
MGIIAGPISANSEPLCRRDIMPGFAVHMVIGDRLQKREPPGPGSCRANFLLGTLAPDMGYVPGGDRFLSDLAHYIRSGQLARNLASAAQGDAGRAFARGWATHVLADVAIHPLINQAAAVLVHGRPDPPLTFADDAIAHIRVEQGLDVTIAAGHDCGGWFELQAAARDPLLAQLQAGFHATYGFVPSRRRLKQSLGTLRWFAGQWKRFCRVAALDLGRTGAVSHSLFAVARGLSRWAPRSQMLALTRLVRPSEGLLVNVGRIIDSLPAEFAAHEARAWRELLDYNLDTGEFEGEIPSYRLSLDTFRNLKRKVTEYHSWQGIEGYLTPGDWGSICW